MSLLYYYGVETYYLCAIWVAQMSTRHYPLFSRLYTSHDVWQKALLMEGTDIGNGKKDMPINGLGTTGTHIHIYSYSSYFCSQWLFMYNLFIRTDLNDRRTSVISTHGYDRYRYFTEYSVQCVCVRTNGKIVKLYDFPFSTIKTFYFTNKMSSRQSKLRIVSDLMSDMMPIWGAMMPVISVNNSYS